MRLKSHRNQKFAVSSVSNLGLIIIDEEHDAAYKPREVKPFSMPKMPLWFCKLLSSESDFGSATPSVESYYAAKW